MRVRLIGHQGEPNMNIGLSGPWHEFVLELKNNGCEIVQGDFGQQIDMLIANSHSKAGIKEAWASNLDPNKKHLILWEPPVIDLNRHRHKILQNYGHVWSPSPDWARKECTKIFKWPQLLLKEQHENYDKWKTRENKAVMVLANKSSATRGELYSLRRELSIKTAQISIMDLYGDNWNLNRRYSYRHYFGKLVRTPIWKISLNSWRYLGVLQKNYKGPSQDKIETCKNYRIIVVLENSRDYVSEKLFDAFASGAIIVYVGANLNKFEIPGDSAIQIEPNSNLIIGKLTELTNLDSKAQYKISRSQQQSILSISTKWHNTLVLKNLASDICLASAGH